MTDKEAKLVDTDSDCFVCGDAFQIRTSAPQVCPCDGAGAGNCARHDGFWWAFDGDEAICPGCGALGYVAADEDESSVAYDELSEHNVRCMEKYEASRKMECTGNNHPIWYPWGWNKERRHWERECAMMGCQVWQCAPDASPEGKRAVKVPGESHDHAWGTWHPVDELHVEDNMFYRRVCPCGAVELIENMAVMGDIEFFRAPLKPQVSDLKTSLRDAIEQRDVAYKKLDAALLQIDAWKRYRALLREELDSAIGLAYVHGWRSTPEMIEAGKRLREELGISEPDRKSQL